MGYQPSQDEMAAGLREANRIMRSSPTPEQRERTRRRLLQRAAWDRRLNAARFLAGFLAGLGVGLLVG